MRTGALLCGLIAGLFALVVPIGVGSQQAAAFNDLLASTPDERLWWSIAWYAPAGAALVAGLLALIAPGAGGLLLLAAAAGWLLISVINPIFFDYLVLAPAGIAFLGALAAFFAGEMAARDRRSLEQTEEQREENAREAIEREVALSVDPLLAARDEAPARPEHDITLSLEDVIPSVEETQPITPDEEIIWPGPAELRSPGSEPPTPKKPIFSRPVPVRRPRPADEPRARREGGVFGWFVTLNAVAVVGLAIAVGYLLVRSPAPTSQAVAEAPAAAPQHLVADASRAYVDPFAYCAAVGTIDRVDARYGGPSFTGEIAEALGVPPQSSPDRVRWRCVEGEVYACSSFAWPDCDATPTAEEMAEFCRRNPAAGRLVAPNGTWSCELGKPKLPADSSWPVDARGFLPSAWIKLARTTGPS